jgi:hypothetical protein
MNKNWPGLTAEVYALFAQHAHLFQTHKNVWSAEEMAIVYSIYNAYTGLKEKDTGCGGCRQGKVQLVRKAYEEYKQSL